MEVIYTHLVPDFSTTHILVIGDVMLDHYWHGSTLRISPEAPVPIVKVEVEEYRPGGAANVAFNIAALGSRVALLGIVGDDKAAVHLKSCLKNNRINFDFLSCSDRKTITKLRVISQSQQLIRLDFEDNYYQINQSLLTDRFYLALNNAHAVVLSDYAKGTLKDTPQIIAEAKKCNLPIIVDPKSTDFRIYSGATVLTPNLAEFEAVVGPCEDDTQLVSRAKRLCCDLGFGAMLVTRGKQGMILVELNSEPRNFPANAAEVFDVTGAGDTVVGVLACSLAAGKSFGDSVALANIAAGIVVGKLGTASVTASELNVVLAKELTAKQGIIAEEALIIMVKTAQQNGERVVMTNGCFDIMHPGHIAYLEKARALGDKLIVAVNDDASVRALKGKNRPLNSLKDRMLMLLALKSVDWVVAFSESTPARLISRISPDILVKGSDYVAAEIAGAEHVLRTEGEVRTLDFIDGYSTTRLIEKIKNNLDERISTS